jgi:hypothetical protein
LRRARRFVVRDGKVVGERFHGDAAVGELQLLVVVHHDAALDDEHGLQQRRRRHPRQGALAARAGRARRAAGLAAVLVLRAALLLPFTRGALLVLAFRLRLGLDALLYLHLLLVCL